MNSQARQEGRQQVQERLLIPKDDIAHRADSTEQEETSHQSKEQKKTGKRGAPILGFWSGALFPRAGGLALVFNLLGHDSAIL